MIKWIGWALLLLLALLFFVPTRVEFTSLSGQITVRLRLLRWLPITLYPRKPRPKRAKKAKPPKKSQEKPATPKPKQKESLLVMDIIQTLNDLLPLLGRSLDYWLRHITLHRCRVRVVIHDEDAAQTGIRCGQMNVAGYTLYAWCSTRIKIREFTFNVVPNFVNQEEPLNVQIFAGASIAALLWGLVLFLCRGGVALLRGPLVAQMMKKEKKQSHTDSKHKRKASPQPVKMKDGVL